MKYLIVFAHPEPASLNGFLRDRAVQALREADHEVEVSDLYAMDWKATVDRQDFPSWNQDRPLSVGEASAEAFSTGTQTDDVEDEQRKLLWADFVVFQFPLWWFSMPAILKGWLDRVYARGFAYGVGTHGGAKWGQRYGEGTLEGRRAMLVTTVGGRPTHYGPRGVNGSIDDILWPIQHGALFYPGMTVVPPTVFYQTNNTKPEEAEKMAQHYIGRLLTMVETEPVPFRTQNGGDYDDQQVLRTDLVGGSSGLQIHQQEPRFVSNTLTALPTEPNPHHLAPSSRKGV